MKRHRWSRGSALGAAAITALLGAGCSGFFDVDNPTNIQDEDVDNPELWTALANAPEGAFSLVYSDLIVASALVSDEAAHALSRTEAIELDQGIMESLNTRRDPIYDDLAVARWVADDVIERFERLLPSPDNDARLAHAYFWAGYSRLSLADHFKEVPINGGPLNPPDVVLEQALPFFDRAAEIAQAAGDQNLKAAALGAKARTSRSLYFERGRDLSHFAAAAQAAEQALAANPQYRLDVRYQQPGSSNAVHSSLGVASGDLGDLIIAPYTNMMDPVSGVREPRIRHSEFVAFAANGEAGYWEEKYGSRDADIPASRWQEAQLILAEYRLLTGDPAGAVARIAVVRASAGLPPYASADPVAILAQLQYERRAEFWLEGRRWQDHRYYGIIPAQWTAAQSALGVNRRWRLSQQEVDANPHYHTP